MRKTQTQAHKCLYINTHYLWLQMSSFNKDVTVLTRDHMEENQEREAQDWQIGRQGHPDHPTPAEPRADCSHLSEKHINPVELPN